MVELVCLPIHCRRGFTEAQEEAEAAASLRYRQRQQAGMVAAQMCSTLQAELPAQSETTEQLETLIQTHRTDSSQLGLAAAAGAAGSLCRAGMAVPEDSRQVVAVVAAQQKPERHQAQAGLEAQAWQS
jgi:hypothetical protein